MASVLQAERSNPVRRRSPAALPPQHFGLLLTATRAAVYIGVATSTFHLLKNAEGFPAPVPVPGRAADSVRSLYRREDLRAWVRSLAAQRRTVS